ncbi:hypothetical protein SprV_0401416300 [Sparganum proliferum]
MVDRGEEVLPFVAVRVLLDLLGLTSRPGVLHLAEPLLHKAATAVESSSVVVGGVGDAGSVQTVFLGQQVADGGVVVVEPGLLLVACATENSQGRRLDCVSQLTPSVLYGGFLLGGGDRNVGRSLS